MTGTLEYKGRQRYVMLKGKTLTICKTKAATDDTETGTRVLSVQHSCVVTTRSALVCAIVECRCAGHRFACWCLD